MSIIQAAAPDGETLHEKDLLETLTKGLAGRFSGQKLLVLIPDHTRSLPLPNLFRALIGILRDVKQLDFMVALGTHPPLNEAAMDRLVGMPTGQRRGGSGKISLENHDWKDPRSLRTIGVMERDEIVSLAGKCWHASLPERVEIRINQAALECDHILILGPVFPHEVVGFSGGAKYLFPGISGPEMIDTTHWLGALSGVVGTIGLKDTPARAMIHAAAGRLKTPVTLAALVMDGHEPAGMFIGDLYAAWEAAAGLSARRNVIWTEKPFRRVLSCAPSMYDELWTAAKAMYKLEPAVETGGEVIIYAPHLDTVSRVHGDHIARVGYHILPYFLADWERFKYIPLGVLAHSTHLRGWGVMEDGVEKPNVKVTLASRIPAEECTRLNLGYRDPASIQLDEWQGQEQEGVLCVPCAGETLYRVRPKS